MSATDWSVEVAVGEPLAEPPEERFEVICLLASTRGPDKVVLSTDLAKDAAVLDTLINVFPGANWHEREAAEMFGYDEKLWSVAPGIRQVLTEVAAMMPADRKTRAPSP